MSEVAHNWVVGEDYCTGCGLHWASAMFWDHPCPNDSSSREDRAQRRKDLRCSFCPPNQGERPQARRAKHGAKPRKRGRGRR